MADPRRPCIWFTQKIGSDSDDAVHPLESRIDAFHSRAKGGVVGGHGIADFDIIFACAEAAVAISNDIMSRLSSSCDNQHHRVVVGIDLVLDFTKRPSQILNVFFGLEGKFLRDIPPVADIDGLLAENTSVLKGSRRNSTGFFVVCNCGSGAHRAAIGSKIGGQIRPWFLLLPISFYTHKRFRYNKHSLFFILN